jgi:hypothetical protein
MAEWAAPAPVAQVEMPALQETAAPQAKLQ